MIYCSQIQECKIRPEIINVNNKEPIFYPHKIKMNRCVGSCNTIDDPYGKTCFANDIENIALKVFNLLSQNNETINIEKHKSCECKCKLNKDACNNKQIWNKDTCKCVFFCVFDNKCIYGYLCLFKNRSTNPLYFGCLNINGY